MLVRSHRSHLQNHPEPKFPVTASGLAAAALSLCLAALPGAASAQSAAQDAPRNSVSYAVKFLCGGSTEEFQEGVVRGVHATAINILNPSFQSPVKFAKRVSRALPYQASGTLTEAKQDQIGPNQAIEVECNEIRQMLPAQMTRQFRTGFLLITATGPLSITAVYTSRPHDGDVSTIDIEQIAALDTAPPGGGDTPQDLPDLVVQRIAGIGVSCPNGAGSCVTTARVRIANIGAGAAGPFTTRTIFDPAQSVIVDSPSPAGLAAGAFEDFSLETPPGGNCFDPDCRICVTVDNAMTVAESDETNNQLCEEVQG